MISQQILMASQLPLYLKSEGNFVTNVAQDNGIVLIRDIYQGPRRAGDIVVIGGDYELVEGSGITTAIFQGH